MAEIGERDPELVPELFEAVQRLGCGGELVHGARRFGTDLFLKLEDERENGAGSSLEDFGSRGPVDGAVVREQVFIFLAVIVVDVRSGDQIAQGSEASIDAIGLRAIG